MDPPRPPGSGRVVTPEAVALDLRTATVATRGLAALLDIVLQALVALLAAVAVAAADIEGVSSTVAVVVVLLAVFVVRVGYPVIFESAFGATVGHMALGLRVVTMDGAPIRVRQALARAAVGMFELDATLGSVALLVAATRADGRRLGDLAAGTQVVSTRVGTGPAVALQVEVPPRLRDWASALDTTGLAQPERAALRRYLTRAPDLPPDRRDALAAALADRLLPRLAAQRPPSTTAHETLTAIAATLTTTNATTPPGRTPPPNLPPPQGPFNPPH